MKKLVLAVIDGCVPAALDAAIAQGRAPVLARIAEEGFKASGSVAAFPSVTPVCATSIATGVLQDRHGIASMNWYHRRERRYVEYGSSFAASRRFGIARQLTDTVYRLNLEHLDARTETVFESLDDADVRTAGTTYLVYRGRHEHRVTSETPLSRMAGVAFRRPIRGPRELFYADLFASRETGCWSRMGMPGMRDQHAGCVGAWLAARDLYDFLLLSLPDNDTHSHEHGPEAQGASIAGADAQLARVAEAAGGLDRFLETHAVIAAADHSHTLVEHVIAFPEAFSEFHVAGPRSDADAEIALCPAQRSAMVYALVPEGRRELLPRIVATARALEGVDVVLWRDDDGRGAIASPRGELRFAPGGTFRDERGATWDVFGELEALGAQTGDGEIRTPDYPDALRRCWAALGCATSGDVILSAAPGWEFPDWGGQHHVGAGSHGSLHACDSLGALVACGVPADRSSWSITDVAPLVRQHFGTAPYPSATR
jgi:hypothetical protein